MYMHARCSPVRCALGYLLFAQYLRGPAAGWSVDLVFRKVGFIVSILFALSCCCFSFGWFASRVVPSRLYRTVLHLLPTASLLAPSSACLAFLHRFFTCLTTSCITTSVFTLPCPLPYPRSLPRPSPRPILPSLTWSGAGRSRAPP